jgi:hypothetical protein
LGLLHHFEGVGVSPAGGGKGHFSRFGRGYWLGWSDGWGTERWLAGLLLHLGWCAGHVRGWL